jgi:hypothetical protein
MSRYKPVWERYVDYENEYLQKCNFHWLHTPNLGVTFRLVGTKPAHLLLFLYVISGSLQVKFKLLKDIWQGNDIILTCFKPKICRSQRWDRVVHVAARLQSNSSFRLANNWCSSADMCLWAHFQEEPS